jgi:hypothetical protein
MSVRPISLALVTAVVVAGGLAVYGIGRTPAAVTPTVQAASPRPEDPLLSENGATLPPNHPPISTGLSNGGGLPPNHPPIDRGSSPQGTVLPASDEAPALAWEVPRGWQTIPNPNAMRLATYRVTADSTDAPEVSVARAGGTAEANIQRWLDQFDQRGADKRTQMRVHGLDVTIVEVSGTYMGGSMMPGAQSASHPGWTLVGAIVPTATSAYFFKLLGPTAKVQTARASFDALVASFAPR